jgi:hypothetical protein
VFAAVSSVVTNCVLTGNSAEYGGGVNGGTLYNCALTGNRAFMGGGACGGTLYNCTLTGNSAEAQYIWGWYGGAGGGAYGSTLYNCTLSNNSASWPAYFGGGGGANACSLYNCIVYFNQGGNWSGGTFAHSCTTPLPPGAGNMAADPRFVNPSAGNFRLRPDSPCIDAGTDLPGLLSSDIAGLPRPLDGDGDGQAIPDMGAYEFDPRTVVPSDWFAQHNLDASDPYVLSVNPDDDGQTSFQEWLAGTDPRDPLSFFRIEAVDAGPPVKLSYQSLLDRVYSLYAASELAGGSGGSTLWVPVPSQLNLPGSGGVDSLTDTNASPHRFYRVGVQLP